MKDIYSITKGSYRDFAEQIAFKIEGRCYLSGAFYSQSGDVTHRLEVNLVVYRDAVTGYITDICDVWWDSYTIVEDAEGEVTLACNDFDFARLRSELI